MQPLNLNIVKWSQQANLFDFSPTSIQASSKWLAIGYAIGSIALFTFETPSSQCAKYTPKLFPKAIILGHTAEVICLLKFPSLNLTFENILYQNLLLSICGDGDIAIWSAEDGVCINRINQNVLNISPINGYLYFTEVYLFSHAFSLVLLYIWDPEFDHIKSLVVYSHKNEDNSLSETLVCFTENDSLKLYDFDSIKLKRYLNNPENRAGIEKLEPDSKKVFNSLVTFYCHIKNQYNPKLYLNKFNPKEFLLVSDFFVRMFEVSGNDLHEKIRWKSDISSSNKFVGADFVFEKSIILWSSSGESILIDLTSDKIDEKINIFTFQKQQVYVIILYDFGLFKKLYENYYFFLAIFSESMSLYVCCKNEDCLKELDSYDKRCGILLNYNYNSNLKKLSLQNMLYKSSSVQGEQIVNYHPYLSEKMDFILTEMWFQGCSTISSDEVSSKLICNERYMILGLTNGNIIATDIINGLWPHESVCNYYFEENIILKGHYSEITAMCQWNRSNKDNDINIKAEVKKKLINNIENETFLITASKDLKVIIFDLKNRISLAIIPLLMSPIVKFFIVEHRVKDDNLNVLSLSINSQIESLIICVATDNSVAVISLITFQVELIFPPCNTPLVSITYTSETNKLKLTYKDYSKKHASLDFIADSNDINKESSQFSYKWASEETSKKIVYPQYDHWLTISSHKYLNFENSYKSFFLANEVLDFDILALEKSAVNGKLTGYNLNLAKVGLSMLFGWGLLGSLDSEVTKVLGVNECNTDSQVSLASVNYSMFTVLFTLTNDPKESWRQSSIFNAQRLLMILVYTKFIFQDNEKLVVNLINFYLTTLPKIVGQGYKSADLYYLAKFFQHERASVRDASRILIYSQIKKLDLLTKTKLIDDCSIKIVNYTSALLHSSNVEKAFISETMVVLSAIASHSPEILTLNIKTALSILLLISIDIESETDDESIRDICVETLIIRNYNILNTVSDSAKIAKNLLLQLFVKLLEQGLEKKTKNIIVQENNSTIKRKGVSQKNPTNWEDKKAAHIDNDGCNGSTSKHGLEYINTATSSSTLNIIKKLESPVLKTISPTLDGNNFTKFIDVNYTEENFEKNQTINLLKSALIHVFVIDSDITVDTICKIMNNQSTSTYELNFIIQILYYIMIKQPNTVYKYLGVLCSAIVNSCRNLYMKKNTDMKLDNIFHDAKNSGSCHEIEIFGLKVTKKAKKVANLFNQLYQSYTISAKEVYKSSKRLLAYMSMNFSTCTMIEGRSTFLAVGIPCGVLDIYEMKNYKLYTRILLKKGALLYASLNGSHYLATLEKDKEHVDGWLSIWDLNKSNGIILQLGLNFEMISNSYKHNNRSKTRSSVAEEYISSNNTGENKAQVISSAMKIMKIPGMYLEPINNMSPCTLNSTVTLTWKANKAVNLSILEASFNLSL
ncbi:hypothetical protein BB561_005706 [Smittium simulii]|uniref:Uncharacterized protein n=1 Tax=Smittium simulii TaxID=133385 RepID=A0A2T9Y8X9_9FUNG|nr:hypothetical protein BB561_005706 [Smittium simulii]